MCSRAISRFVIGLLIAGLLLLTAATVASWRHRHAGTAGHTHGHRYAHRHDHSHGHSRSHSHGHSHQHGHSHDHGRHAHHLHAREGWHVHISLFGLELTLWEPQWNEAVLADTAPQTEPERDDGKPVLVAASPITAGWASLFWIDPAPVPARTRMPAVDVSARWRIVDNFLYSSPLESPPVPPPRNV